MGNSWQVQYGRLHDIPLFAKAGAIVPLGPKVGWGGIDNPETIDLHCFTGASGEFTLYEDDGESLAYQKGSYALTTFRQVWRDDEMTMTVTAVSGDTSHIPSNRSYRFHLRGISQNATLIARLDGQLITLAATYDTLTESWQTDPLAVPATSTFNLTASGAALLAPRDRLPETIDDMLRAFRLETIVKTAVAHNAAQLPNNPELLQAWEDQLCLSQMQALLEVTQQADSHQLPDFASGKIIKWDNKQLERTV